MRPAKSNAHPPSLIEVLAVVRRLHASAEARGIRLVGVVGSIARGEACAGSDVDILYDVAGTPSLMDAGEVQMDLQDALGCHVDVIARQGLRPERRAFIERDLVVV